MKDKIFYKSDQKIRNGTPKKKNYSTQRCTSTRIAVSKDTIRYDEVKVNTTIVVQTKTTRNIFNTVIKNQDM